jgi:subfamily B ATP-binding cassette protein MsbA
MSAQNLLLTHAKPYPWRILASIVLGLSGAVFNGIGTTLIVPAVFSLLDSTAAASTVQLPPLLHLLTVPLAGLTGEVQAVAMLSIIVVTIALKNLANYFSLLSSASLIRRLTQDLRSEGIELLLTVNLDYHNRMQTGDIIQRLNDQIGKAVTAIGAIIGLVQSSVNILFFVAVLLSISWSLTVAAIFFLGGILWLNKSILARAKYFGHRLATASKHYSVRTLEMLNGIRLIKASATEPQEFETLQHLIQRREEAAFKSQANAAVIGPLNEILSILALVAMILVSRFLLAGSATSAPLLLTFLFVLTRLIQCTGQLNTARNRLASSAASVDLVYDFLRRDNKSFLAQGRRQLNGLHQGIRFDQVTFKYPPWPRPGADRHQPACTERKDPGPGGGIGGRQVNPGGPATPLL